MDYTGFQQTDLQKDILILYAGVHLYKLSFIECVL